MTKATRSLISLDRAMDDFKLPMENREFVREFAIAIGIEGCAVTSAYIKVIRTDGGPDVRIASGYSNGFVDEAEALRVTGGAHPVWASEKRKGFWGVDHPLGGRPSSTASRARQEERSFGTCERHFQPNLPTGNCWMCDE